MKEAILKNSKIQKKILEVAELAQYLWQKGWAERNAGNISVNLTHLVKEEIQNMERYPVFSVENEHPQIANGYFFVTGTGKRMRDLARNPMKNACIIKMNERGNEYHIISKNKKNLYDFRPTSELPTHLAIHNVLVENNSPNKVVVHTHPNELVALTQIREFQDEKKLNKLLWGMHPESVVFVPRGLALVPYILPGTKTIADATLQRIKDHDVVMWEKHGTFAVGPDVFDAFDMIDILSKSARIYFMVKSAGFEPEGLSEDQLKELLQAFHK
ncbi:MAG: rhamnulose-1-phosphate aldolase [Bacteroidales bacterium]